MAFALVSAPHPSAVSAAVAKRVEISANRACFGVHYRFQVNRGMYLTLLARLPKLCRCSLEPASATFEFRDTERMEVMTSH